MKIEISQNGTKKTERLVIVDTSWLTWFGLLVLLMSTTFFLMEFL